jgi:UDP-glucose 4-epimerase
MLEPEDRSGVRMNSLVTGGAEFIGTPFVRGLPDRGPRLQVDDVCGGQRRENLRDTIERVERGVSNPEIAEGLGRTVEWYSTTTKAGSQQD